MTDTHHPVIGFIGAGNMAQCLINGLISEDYPAEKLLTSNRHHSIENNLEIIAKSDIIVLAVKPQSMKKLCTDIKDGVQIKKPLIISIAAGITEQSLSTWFGAKPLPIVRCMPNIAAVVSSSATGLFANHHTSPLQKDLAESILRSVGLTLWVTDEKLIDVISGLSGSGPAYFFFIIEALEQSAIQLGLAPEEARLLLLQTALGAARLAFSTSESIAELRQRVTSKGGITEKAIDVLDNNNVKKIFHDALNAAHDRSIEISTQLI